jgi:hypothetical protein
MRRLTLLKAMVVAFMGIIALGTTNRAEAREVCYYCYTTCPDIVEAQALCADSGGMCPYYLHCEETGQLGPCPNMFAVQCWPGP